MSWFVIIERNWLPVHTFSFMTPFGAAEFENPSPIDELRYSRPPLWTEDSKEAVCFPSREEACRVAGPLVYDSEVHVVNEEEAIRWVLGL